MARLPAGRADLRVGLGTLSTASKRNEVMTVLSSAAVVSTRIMKFAPNVAENSAARLGAATVSDYVKHFVESTSDCHGSWR